ncbi:MAG: hypothetical protein GX331_07700 [Firmicutes bacterium]|jgi:hypothetical protein|nr:hypothetical protein [Bacillota bacterium]
MKLILPVLLAVFTLGYGIGRRVGFKQGQSLGRAAAVVEIRAESLKKDYCIVCHQKKQKDLTNSITN